MLGQNRAPVQITQVSSPTIFLFSLFREGRIIFKWRRFSLLFFLFFILSLLKKKNIKIEILFSESLAVIIGDILAIWGGTGYGVDNAIYFLDTSSNSWYRFEGENAPQVRASHTMTCLCLS